MPKKTATKKRGASTSVPGIDRARQVQQLLRRGIALERKNVRLAQQLAKSVARADEQLLELGGMLMGRAAVLARRARGAANVQRETREQLESDRARVESQHEADRQLAGRAER